MIDKKQYKRQCPICHKSIKWLYGKKPEVCPYCKSIKWDKPLDECTLFNLQKKYLKSKDKDILGEMYKVLYPYTKNIILKMLKRCSSYDDDKLADKVQDTVTYFLSYYLRKDYYCVTDSFGQILILGAHQQLHNKKVKNIDQKEFSYDRPMKEGEDSFLEEMVADKIPLEMEKDSIENDLINFIDKMYLSMYKSFGLRKALLSLKLFHFYLINKRFDFFDNFYDVFGTDLKESLEKEKLALYEFISELKTLNYNYYEGTKFN